MSQIKFEDLPKIREKYKKDEVVFCSGGFDLTHAGHVLFFEDCKKYGDILVVGVSSGIGGSRKREPILNKYLRLKMVDSLKPVDYTFVMPSIKISNSLEKIKYIMEKLHPDVYVVNDDANDIPYRQKISEELNVKLVILQRWCPEEFEKISTTKIIGKIKEL